MDNMFENTGVPPYKRMNDNNNGFMGQGMPQQQFAAIQPVNCNMAMNITSASDLQSYAAGVIVRFPDFAEGQPFIARVRRPSMLVLAKSGKIPNNLLTTAGELFSKGGGGLDTDNKNMLSDMYEIMHTICEAALIQPTLSEIESVGLQLSDDQLMAIFNYSQVGVKALESFRQE
ncbi:MAG: hypothetical protein IKK92_02015 [Prevotella sp.]|nr:hypothetical protein [Prevotella sp.]